MTLSIRTAILFFCSILSISVLGQSETYKTTPSGVKYKITPPALPEPGDFVYFHAEMRTQRDSILFSTRDRDEPPVVNVAGPEVSDNIGPVEDVIRYLSVGAKAEITVDLTELTNKPPGMGEDTIVYYDVEILEIVSAEQFELRKAQQMEEEAASRALVQSRATERLAFHKNIREKYRNSTLDKVMTTSSGLKYVIHEMGEGDKPDSGDNIAVHYIGSLVTGGEPFDGSFKRGEPIKFQVGIGRVIPGWDEGLQLLPYGTKATLFIPAELGYGEKGTPDGSIPPNTEITFYVELE